MELSVEGYKSIASKQTLLFEGLTILSGANSSGKSSFMQPFLILKQTIENHYDSGSLELYGENAKLTDSTQIISKVPGYQKNSFSLDLKNDKVSCRVTYKYKRGYGLQVESSTLINSEMPKGMTLKVDMTSKDVEKNIPKDEIELFKRLFEHQNVTPVWKVVRNKCFIQAAVSFKGKKIAPLNSGINPTASIAEFVTRLIHVPGLRGNPERIYKIAATDSIYPGSFEKYVASIISNWSKLKIHATKYEELKSQLVELGLASNIKTAKIDDTSVEIQISRSINSKSNDCVNIADVGFGVSQTLPVLVALIGAKKGQYVYIEQPELHLHPKAQFKLSSIIASAINRGVRVIIETHSSILIRGIQISAVNGGIDKGKVSLNWFTQDLESGETNVSKALLDEFGAFGEWPEDFDDTSLAVEQMYLDAVEKKAYE